jgi:hypothetical protein
MVKNKSKKVANKAANLAVKKVTKKLNKKLRRRNFRRKKKVNKPQLFNTFNWKRSMKIVRSTEDSMIVSGTDLVYQVPDIELSEAKKVLCIIPANPAYWIGTRISSLALSYNQYRPLRFVVHYVPIVSAMQQGAIFGGTIWGTAPTTTNLQQTLVTSPGRINTQVYQPRTGIVKLGKRLPKNTFTIGGELNDESNPFNYVAIGVANYNQNNVRVTPGYFVVSYTYSFSNPLGNNLRFGVQSLIPFSDLSYRSNTTIINCNPNKEDSKGNFIPLFTRLQVNRNDDGLLEVSYNGEFVLMKEDDLIWSFTNFNQEYSLERVTRNISTGDPYLKTNNVYNIPARQHFIYPTTNKTIKFVYNYADNLKSYEIDEVLPINNVYAVYHMPFAQTTYLDGLISYLTRNEQMVEHLVVEYPINEYQYLTFNGANIFSNNNLIINHKNNYLNEEIIINKELNNEGEVQHPRKKPNKKRIKKNNNDYEIDKVKDVQFNEESTSESN